MNDEDRRVIKELVAAVEALTEVLRRLNEDEPEPEPQGFVAAREGDVFVPRIYPSTPGRYEAGSVTRDDGVLLPAIRAPDGSVTVLDEGPP
jgi:hypothetical protein